MCEGRTRVEFSSENAKSHSLCCRVDCQRPRPESRRRIAKKRAFIPASRSTSVRTSSTSLSTNSTGDGSSGGAKRTYSTPGHTWRFKKNKAAKIQSIPKNVWLLDTKPHEEVKIGSDGQYEDYSVYDDMVLLKGEFDLIRFEERTGSSF